MIKSPKEITNTINRLALGVQTYLQASHGIDCIAMPVMNGNAESLTLKDTTAIIGLGGLIGALVTVSFEKKLLSRLLLLETAGLQIPSEDHALYLRETASEITNIIVGRCLADLQSRLHDDDGKEHKISMSPPVVIENVNHLHKSQGGCYTSVLLSTIFGSLAISMVWPRELFNEILHGLNVEGVKQ